MSDIGTLNYLWSQAMVAGFVASGVVEAVISPGSRSTPLALAMLRQPALRCHVAVDERSAAFFGLGLAKASQSPVLLLATSGSAPANWLPAVIEASQSGVPLILISADRPPELHDCGANQTIDQFRLFGSHVRASHALGTPDPGFMAGYLHRLAAQVCEEACWPHPGPVHINQPFREPLLPTAAVGNAELPHPVGNGRPTLQAPVTEIAALADCLSHCPGIIVCGEMPARPGQAQAIAELAKHLDCPILAEPLSGLRFGSHDRSLLSVRYHRWLSDTTLTPPQPEWILRFGAYPVTRQLQNYLNGKADTIALIDPWPRWSDPTHRLTHLLRADPATTCAALLAAAPEPAPTGWMDRFRQLEATATGGADHIEVLVDILPNDCALFIGNSLAIRQFDAHSGSTGKSLHVYGSRGASGIDGNISTAAGIATVHGRAVALLGDLTCQHDVGGLALARGRNLVIVAVNNGGGGIFDFLPQRELPEFSDGWRTPQHIDFAQAAGSFGLTYALAESAAALRPALDAALQAGGAHLIELRPE